jgi:outer membrane lipoprotein-sorting protein
MSLGGHMRRLTFAALLTAALVTLASCGGNDEDDASAAAEEALTSTDPSSCTELQTENYRQQIQLSSGEFAITACQQELSLTAADSAEVTRVEVDGDTATVDVAHTGSAFDGQVISYEMVKDDGQWKLDLLAGFAEFDKAAFARSLDALSKEAEGLNPPEVECYNDQLKALSVEELEDLYTSGDFRKYSKLSAACQ